MARPPKMRRQSYLLLDRQKGTFREIADEAGIQKEILPLIGTQEFDKRYALVPDAPLTIDVVFSVQLKEPARRPGRPRKTAAEEPAAPRRRGRRRGRKPGRKPAAKAAAKAPKAPKKAKAPAPEAPPKEPEGGSK